MARQARCNRAHSAVSHQVNVIEAGSVNVHAAFLKFSSGQLPFLGYILQASSRKNHANRQSMLAICEKRVAPTAH